LKDRAILIIWHSRVIYLNIVVFDDIPPLIIITTIIIMSTVGEMEKEKESEGFYNTLYPVHLEMAIEMCGCVCITVTAILW